ncbi:hypothetical protein HG440_002925 [Candidatus Saccharibacteria bacterium]|nr:hypothetical protein [Candidatus Saccharibacteria bacterium]
MNSSYRQRADSGNIKLEKLNDHPQYNEGGGPRDSSLQVTLQAIFLPSKAADFFRLADIIDNCQSVVINHTENGCILSDWDV